MLLRFIWIGLLILSHTVSLFGLHPDKRITQYMHESWQIENGLPQNSISDITQAKDGFIYFGTEEGVVQYDGHTFAVYNHSTHPIIRNNFISSIYPSRKGGIWFGTINGDLYYLQNHVLENKYNLYSDYLEVILDLYEDSQNRIWIASSSSALHYFKNHTFHTLSPTITQWINQHVNPDFNAVCVTQDHEGAYWIGANNDGVLRIADESYQHFTTENGLLHNTVLDIVPSKDGGVWIGTDGRGLQKWNHGVFLNYTEQQGLSNNNIRTLYEDKFGCLWIGTQEGGLNRLYNNKIETFKKSDGLTENWVSAISEDHEGNLWVGTAYSGLNCLKQGKFTALTTKEGLSHDLVFSVYEDEDKAGTLWIGTYGGGLNYYDGTSITSYTIGDGLTSNIISDVCKDAKGRLWVGSYRSGLNCLQDGMFIHHPIMDELTEETVNAIGKDSQQNLWIGSFNGVYKILPDDRYIQLESPFPDKPIRINNIVEDSKGRIWLGTFSEGLFYVEGTQIKRYTPTCDFNITSCLDFYEDSEGILWIASFGGGLYQLTNNVLTRFTTEDGLFHDSIFKILEDNDHRFWMCNNNGIFMVKRQDLMDYQNNLLETIPYKQFGLADGMPSQECNGGIGHSAHASKDASGYVNTLYFSTVKGLVHIDPNKILFNDKPPSTHLKYIVVNGERIEPTQQLTLPPGEHTIMIHYTACSFLYPNHVQFKFQLVGYNENFVDAGNQRNVTYTNLDPGTYTFKVLGSNNDGVWSEKPAEFKLIIQPAFTETVFFYLLVAFGFLMIGGGGSFTIFRFRQKNLQNKTKTLETLVEQRTQELQTQYNFLETVLESLSNPFFIIDAKSLEITGANHVAQAMGITKGSYCPNFFCFHQNVCKANRKDCLVQNVSNTGEPAHFERILSGSTDDDERYYWEIFAYPVHAESGEVTQVIEYAVDITERKIKDRIKQDTERMVKHDLKIPLNAIIGFADLLRRQEIEEKNKTLIQHIFESGHRMLDMLNTSLSLLKIEEGQYKPRLEPVNLLKIFNQIEKESYPRYASLHISFLFSLHGKPISLEEAYIIHGEELLLRNLFANLINNAQEAAFENEVITIDIQETEMNHEIHIHNQAPVPEEIKNTFFKRYTTHGKIGGTGLGTYNARLIAKVHGGNVTVSSSKNDGTLVTVILPKISNTTS